MTKYHEKLQKAIEARAKLRAGRATEVAATVRAILKPVDFMQESTAYRVLESAENRPRPQKSSIPPAIATMPPRSAELEQSLDDETSNGCSS